VPPESENRGTEASIPKGTDASDAGRKKSKPGGKRTRRKTQEGTTKKPKQQAGGVRSERATRKGNGK